MCRPHRARIRVALLLWVRLHPAFSWLMECEEIMLIQSRTGAWWHRHYAGECVCLCLCVSLAGCFPYTDRWMETLERQKWPRFFCPLCQRQTWERAQTNPHLWFYLNYTGVLKEEGEKMRGKKGWTENMYYLSKLGLSAEKENKSGLEKSTLLLKKKIHRQLLPSLAKKRVQNVLNYSFLNNLFFFWM